MGQCLPDDVHTWRRWPNNKPTFVFDDLYILGRLPVYRGFAVFIDVANLLNSTSLSESMHETRPSENTVSGLDSQLCLKSQGARIGVK